MLSYHMTISFIQRYYHNYCDDLHKQGFSARPSFTESKLNEWVDAYETGAPIPHDFIAFAHHAYSHFTFSVDELQNVKNNPQTLPWFAFLFSIMNKDQLSIINECDYDTVSFLLPILSKNHFYRYDYSTSYASYVNLILKERFNIQQLIEDIPPDSHYWKHPLIRTHFLDSVLQEFRYEKDTASSTVTRQLTYVHAVMEHHQMYPYLNTQAYVSGITATKYLAGISVLYQQNPAAWMDLIKSIPVSIETLLNLNLDKEYPLFVTMALVVHLKKTAQLIDTDKTLVENFVARYIKMHKMNKSIKEKVCYNYAMEQAHSLFQHWNCSTDLIATMNSLDISLSADDLIALIYQPATQETSIILD